MVPVEVLINFGPLLQVLRVPVVRKMVLVHKVSHNGGTACVATEREKVTSLSPYQPPRNICLNKHPKYIYCKSTLISEVMLFCIALVCILGNCMCASLKENDDRKLDSIALTSHTAQIRCRLLWAPTYWG